MRALVTGGAGFVGRHLLALLREEGSEVFSLDHRPQAPEGASALTVDLADAASVAHAVRVCAPDLVFHLAARTPATAADATPAEWLGGDPAGTFHLLEAVRAAVPEARVLVVSSSAVYGHVPLETMPIGEDRPLEPVTLYGIAKAAVELVALRAHRAYGLQVVRARPFNLVGPGEPPAMLTSTLAAQVARIRRGEAPPVLRMRHRATSRDYTDVRDAVRAYRLLIEKGVPGEAYNVCSGQATAIGELAERLLTIARVAATIEETEGVPAAGDIATQAGNPAQLVALTGWAPAIPLERSLAELLATA